MRAAQRRRGLRAAPRTPLRSASRQAPLPVLRTLAQMLAAPRGFLGPGSCGDLRMCARRGTTAHRAQQLASMHAKKLQREQLASRKQFTFTDVLGRAVRLVRNMHRRNRFQGDVFIDDSTTGSWKLENCKARVDKTSLVVHRRWSATLCPPYGAHHAWGAPMNMDAILCIIDISTIDEETRRGLTAFIDRFLS